MSSPKSAIKGPSIMQSEPNVSVKAEQSAGRATKSTAPEGSPRRHPVPIFVHGRRVPQEGKK